MLDIPVLLFVVVFNACQCQYDCLSRQFGTTQCSTSCQESCGRVCSRTPLPVKPVQALQSPFLQQPETKNSPLKINIELTGDKYDSSPAQLADVCAPAKPSQMIVKDVATYPVRLDPVQRCATECQSVCQMACKRQISQASCIDACAPQCDRACTSPQVQKNSADLFARSPLHDSSPEHDDESLSSKSAVEIPLKVYIKMADQQEPTTVR
ncbi:unnamed protein product [Nippostrongylus brasiliensis]|uniref:Uncharacterized protein n=1 Tax=Nippostrongylus brasiliensis TaxID=27835 RepID=A0A158R264_NIPBR|nr:unnamed protein product [Nippostrongylus brasiliensis]